MAGESRLARNIRDLVGGRTLTIYQGEVTKVDGSVCTVKFANQEISDIRLRASSVDVDKQMLITPKVGSSVVVGSLSGDLSELVVLQVDEVESIEINGGEFGGLIKIGDLTDKLNKLVREVNALKNTFNSHTHTGTIEGTSPSGPVTGSCNVLAPSSQAQQATEFNKDDYEDTTIKH